MNGRAAVLVVAVAVCALGTGCAPGKDPTVSLGESEAPVPRSTVRPLASQDPVKAFVGWFDAVHVAERELNPNHPALTSYGQGTALADVRERIDSFRSQGVRVDKPSVVIRPAITARGVVEGKKVTEVTACVIDPANSFVDVKTGKPKAPKEAPQGTKEITSMFVGIMLESPDGWRIEGARVGDVENCSEIG